MLVRRTGLALALVVLLGAVLALYYLTHKPLTPDQALAFAQSLGNLAVALGLTLLGGGLGRRLLRPWFAGAEVEPASHARSVIEVALGWGGLGLALLLLGALRLYYPLVMWGLTVALLVGLSQDMRGWLSEVLALARGLAPVGRLDRLAAGFTLLVLVLGLLRALAPPVTWDALVYHLTLPALYERAHGWQVNPLQFNLFSGMPQLNEMLYTAALLLRVDSFAGGIAAQVLGWFFGLAVCLGLAAAARDLGLPAWLAPAILFSSLSVALELAWAYADLLLMLLALATVLALAEWRRRRAAASPSDRWLALAGVLAGLAWGCKYTGLVVPLAGAVVVFLVGLFARTGSTRERLARALWSTACFGILAGLAFAPWLLKNWVLTGSPVYPLVWPAADMDALRLWFYNRPDLAEPFWRAPFIFLRATFIGVQGGNEFDATLGPLLLLCAGLLVFVWGRLARALRAELALLLGFVGVAYLGWVALAQYAALARQARLFFALLPPLALLGAAGLRGARELDLPTLRLSLVVKAIVALVLALGAIELATEFVSENPLPYVAGAQTAADFETARLGWYVPALARVNALPAGSRVVFLWEARSLACTAAIVCVPDVAIDRWWHARRTVGVGSAEQIIAQWRSDGATEVLLYDTGARFIQGSADNGYTAADWSELDKLRGELRPVAAFGEDLQHSMRCRERA